MKSKAVLTQIELVIMVLVFAVSAAICLKVFAFSDLTSKNDGSRDSAMLALQNSAELIKDTRGDLEACAELLGGEVSGDTWVISYENGDTLTAVKEENAKAFLGTAKLQFCCGKDVYDLEIAWQEEAA